MGIFISPRQVELVGGECQVRGGHEMSGRYRLGTPPHRDAILNGEMTLGKILQGELVLGWYLVCQLNDFSFDFDVCSRGQVLQGHGKVVPFVDKERFIHGNSSEFKFKRSPPNLILTMGQGRLNHNPRKLRI